MEINLSDSRGRDAVVSLDSVTSPLRVRWIDAESKQATSARILKSTLDRDVDALVEKYGDLDKVGEALVTGDPEIDLEQFGSMLSNTSRVYISPKREVVHRVIHWEVVKNPDGSERDRRRQQTTEPNVAAEVPLKWTGKTMPKEKACRRFVFASLLQITHVNGLTYDFLYGMAKELEERKALMLLGAGPKGNQPLVLRHNGTSYRGFLEGRTDGDRYALLLHLSNMELKKPEAQEEE